jgi:hypothetical protein
MIKKNARTEDWQRFGLSLASSAPPWGKLHGVKRTHLSQLSELLL